MFLIHALIQNQLCTLIKCLSTKSDALKTNITCEIHLYVLYMDMILFCWPVYVVYNVQSVGHLLWHLKNIMTLYLTGIWTKWCVQVILVILLILLGPLHCYGTIVIQLACHVIERMKIQLVQNSRIISHNYLSTSPLAFTTTLLISSSQSFGSPSLMSSWSSILWVSLSLSSQCPMALDIITQCSHEGTFAHNYYISYLNHEWSDLRWKLSLCRNWSIEMFFQHLVGHIQKHDWFSMNERHDYWQVFQVNTIRQACHLPINW